MLLTVDIASSPHDARSVETFGPIPRGSEWTAKRRRRLGRRQTCSG